MKLLIIISCLLVGSIATDTPLSLQDISQPSLTTSKQIETELQPQQTQLFQSEIQLQLPPQQQQQSAIPQLSPASQFYFPPPPPPPPQPPQQPLQQGPPQASTGPHQFSPDARNFPPPPPLSVQYPNRLPQQQLLLHPVGGIPYLGVITQGLGMQPPVQAPVLPPGQQQPIGAGTEQQYQFQYASASPYGQYLPQPVPPPQPTPPPPPQYVYVEPSAVTPLQQAQSKVGGTGVQYVQYVDRNTALLRDPQTHINLLNHHHPVTHNLAGLIQKTAHTNVLPLNYRQPAPQTYRQQNMAQPLVSQALYVLPQPTATNFNPFYQRNNQILAQQRYLMPPQPQPAPQPQFPQLQPLPQQQQIQQLSLPFTFYDQQQAQPSNVVFQQKQPQTLLDSYIPSVLQVQFYKQLQSQLNTVQPTGKLPLNIGKNDALKTVVPQQQLGVVYKQ